LRKLATATGGFCESVTPNERIDDAMMRVVRRIRSVPVVDSSLVCGDAVRAWQSGTLPQYRGTHQLLTGALDRSAAQELIVDGDTYPLEMVQVPAALHHDFVRTVAASHLQNVTGQFKIDWAVTHQLVTDETAVVAIAEHEADKKVIGHAINVKVQQQMANDWHGGVLHAVMHAMPQSMPRHSSPRSSPRRAVMDVDVDAEFEMDAASVSYAPMTDQPDRLYAFAPPTSSPARPRGAHRFAALLQELLRQKPDVTTITLADLLAAGFDSDTIDACRSIAGYSEQLIVLALCVVVLGNAQAKKLKLPVTTVPVALLGGLKVIVGA
jgi:CBS domain-containing protein